MNVDAMTLARARLALSEAARGYLFESNINLIDFGNPFHSGQLAEDELTIRFHTQEKLSGYDLEMAITSGQTKYIPEKIGGFATDVIQGTYQAHQWWWGRTWRRPVTNPRAARADPMRGGMSISDERYNSYGTLGGLVVDRVTGEEMILGNWHVLVVDWYARPGQRIYQPGRLTAAAA